MYKRQVYTKVIRVYYYVNEERGIKVPIKEVEVDFSKRLKGKPTVVVKTNGKRVIISGDTYYVKDRLKELRFRWSSIDRVWWKETEEPETIVNELRDKLADVAEVMVE